MAGSEVPGNIGVMWRPNGIDGIAGIAGIFAESLAGDVAGAFAMNGLVAAIAGIAAVSICEGLVAMEMADGARFTRVMVGLIAGIVAGIVAVDVAGSGKLGCILMFCQPSGIAAVAGDTRE